MSSLRKVAYYLPRFPRLSETFILREILVLRRMGVDVQIFSLLPPLSSSTTHPQVQEVMPHVHYSPFLFSLRLILAQFFFLFRSPGKYLRALYHVIWMTLPEPSTLIKALLLFPKSVFFARQLQEIGALHVHAHFVWVNGISAQVAADLIGIPYSLHAHAWDIFQRKPEAVRRQILKANKIVTISNYHRQYLSKLCPERDIKDIHVVHCGLDPREFAPAHVQADGKTRIISVGRLLTKKGIEYLIDACALLKQKGYAFQCSIIGEGPLESALQERIEKHLLKDSVTLLGARPITEVLNAYRQSDMFVLPCIVTDFGDRDGIPVVLMEAMAMEVPVITTPVAGNPELVLEEVNGLMVPERDSQALAAAMERYINDPILHQRLGREGRNTILAEFDVHSTTKQMAEIFFGGNNH